MDPVEILLVIAMGILFALLTEMVPEPSIVPLFIIAVLSALAAAVIMWIKRPRRLKNKRLG